MQHVIYHISSARKAFPKVIHCILCNGYSDSRMWQENKATWHCKVPGHLMPCNQNCDSEDNKWWIPIQILTLVAIKIARNIDFFASYDHNSLTCKFKTSESDIHGCKSLTSAQLLKSHKMTNGQYQIHGSAISLVISYRTITSHILTSALPKVLESPRRTRDQVMKSITSRKFNSIK